MRKLLVDTCAIIWLATGDRKLSQFARDASGGCSDSIAYMEQSSWLLFLRYLDDREAERKNEAMVLGRPYTPALPKELAWSTWAYPVDKDGNFDRDNAAISADAECALPIRPVMCECHEHEGSPDAVGAH